MLCIGLLVMWCDVTKPAPSADTFCAIAKPIYWNAGDTRGTKEQADTFNRKWKALCREKGK